MQEKQEIIVSYLKKSFEKMDVLLPFHLFLRPLIDAEYFQNKKQYQNINQIILKFQN